MRTGGCLCGAVRYRVAGPLTGLAQCHCSRCRRWSGHGFAAASAARDALEVEGEVAWYVSTPGAIRRGFCPTCGSSLFWDRLASPAVDILAGTLDTPTGLALQDHVFVAGKGDYYAIADDLPQYPATRP